MIEVYGKNNCINCVKIKKQLDNFGIEYEYFLDDNLIVEKAIELKNNKKLIEMTAPLILKDGVQIRHKDLKTILQKGE